MSRPSFNAAGRQLRLGLQRPPAHGWADFIVSSSNAAAVAAIEAWPSWPGGKLLLVGPEGSGKTHLASAWAAKSGAAYYRSGETDETRVPRPILLEDADRRASEEALFHALNRADDGAGLLITSRTPPGVWTCRLPDLRSRLNSLTLVTIEPADDALLLGVIEKLFSERNIKAPPDLAPYVIRRIERSAAAARDFVQAMDEVAAAEGREVGLPLARRLLQAAPEPDLC